MPLLLVSAHLADAPVLRELPVGADTGEMHGPVLPHAPAATPDGPPRREVLRRLLARRAPALTGLEHAMLAEAILAGERHGGVEALLTLAVIEQESAFEPEAVSTADAVGLMQVRPFVGADVARRTGIPWNGRRTLLNPVRNVQLGMAYLAEMQSMYAQRELALAAYNLGPYRVQGLLEAGRDVPGRYARNVLRRYGRLRAELLRTAADSRGYGARPH